MDIQCNTKRGRSVFSWTAMTSWTFAHPFVGFTLPYSFLQEPIRNQIREMYRLIGKTGMEEHPSKPPDACLIKPYTDVKKVFDNQPFLDLASYHHNNVRDSQPIYGLCCESDWKDKDTSGWLCQSRLLEEESVGICASYIVSAHEDVAAAVPITLSREMMPQMEREIGKTGTDGKREMLAPLSKLSASIPTGHPDIEDSNQKSLL